MGKFTRGGSKNEYIYIYIYIYSNKSCRSSQLCLLLILEWSLYFEHVLRSRWLDVNHSTPLYIWALGLKDVEWMENYMDFAWHKRITCQRLPHQVLYLLSYGMLCHDGNFLMTQPVNKLKNVVIQFTFSSSTFGMFASQHFYNELPSWMIEISLIEPLSKWQELQCCESILSNVLTRNDDLS